jgi:hypothetical protein
VPDQSPDYRKFIEARVDAVEAAGGRQHAEVMAALATQNVTLGEIKRNVEKTNGRVNGHDVKIAVLMLAYAAGAFMAGAWYVGVLKP